MDILYSILNIVINFLCFVLILRSWLQFCQVDPYMPLSQSLLRLTQPLIAPISKIIPTVKNINMPAILLAVILYTAGKWIIGVPIALSVLIGILGVLKTFGQILFFTTLIRALMSWVTQGNHPLDYMVAQITEPVLSIIRRIIHKIIPNTGMLDFSVMVLGILLIILNSFLYKTFGTLWAIA